MDDIKFDVNGVLFTLSREALIRYPSSSLTKIGMDYMGEPLVLEERSSTMFGFIARYLNASACDSNAPLDLSDLSVDGLQRLGREVCAYDLHDMARRVSNEVQRRRRQACDEDNSREDARDQEIYLSHKPCHAGGDAQMPRIGDHVIGKANSGASYNRCGRIQSMSMRRIIYTAKQDWEDEFEGDYADVVCQGDIRWEDGTSDTVPIWSIRDGQNNYYFQYDPRYPSGLRNSDGAIYN